MYPKMNIFADYLRVIYMYMCTVNLSYSITVLYLSVLYI